MYSFVPWFHYELRIAVCDQVNWCDSKWVRWTIWNWLAQIYWGTTKSDRTNNKYKKSAIAKMRQARSQRDEQIEKKFGEIATAYLYWIDTDVLNYNNWWIYWLHIQPKKIFILLHLLYMKRYSVVRDFFFRVLFLFVFLSSLYLKYLFSANFLFSHFIVGCSSLSFSCTVCIELIWMDIGID